MTAFTVTTTQRISALASKTSSDTYAVNGGTLIIDQDSRYGENQNTSASLSNITISSSLGGVVSIDARYVRLIPFNTGSGNVPAAGTVISQGAVTGKLIGVWSAINVAPTAAGSAMPASGFIKIKEASQVPGFSAGALTGIGANATGADVAGWIEVVGDESATCTVPRLGSVEIKGEWFEVGSTSGSNATTYQLPTSGSSHWFPGVFVETGTGTGVFEAYPCVGSFTGANTIGTDAVRGKFCWITTAGVLQFGSDGTNAIGYVPPSGRRIVIPNVILANCNATKTNNAVPNATLGTRYDFTTTSGGVVSIDKAMCSWYPSFSRPTSVSISNTLINEQLYMYYPGSAVSLSKVATGVTVAQAAIALSAPGFPLGCTATDCVWLTRSGGHTLNVSDIENATFTRNKFLMLTGFTAGYYTYVVRAKSVSFVDCVVGPQPFYFEYSADVTFSSLTYIGRLGSSATRGPHAVSIGNANVRVLVDGLNQCDSDGYGTGALCYVSGTNNQNIEWRNLGTLGLPMTMMGALLSTGGSFNKGIKVRRVYFNAGAVASMLSFENTTNLVSVENIFRTGGSGDWINNLLGQNHHVKGVRTASPPANSPASLGYGTHWTDWYSSDTVGVLRLDYNEPSALTGGLVTLGGGAKFTGGGYIYMPTVGDSVTVEMDYFALGHTGFANATPTAEYGVFTKYNWEYQIDTGSGWSAWKSLTGANLSGETVNPATGVKLKVRATTNTGNTDVMSALKIATTTTLTDQRTLYPLGSASLTVGGLAAGSMVKVTKISDGTVLGTAPESGGSATFSLGYEGPVSIDVRKASSSPYYRPWTGQATTSFTSPVTVTALQQLDE